MTKGSDQYKKPVTYAFIDSQNLNLGVQNDILNNKGKVLYTGRKLDFKKFHDYLHQKYHVDVAYLFIGFVSAHTALYAALQQAGFILIFKEIASHFDEEGLLVTKGNVDTDITLFAAARLFEEYDRAIFVSGDGDFLSLYDYLEEKGKLHLILAPNRFSYSKLLNKYRHKLKFVSDLRPIFRANKTTRSGDRREP
ncbi:MAG TPA: NYN domain-containing protein [Candidatus Saccharimonadales bacterium]